MFTVHCSLGLPGLLYSLTQYCTLRPPPPRAPLFRLLSGAFLHGLQKSEEDQATFMQPSYPRSFSNAPLHPRPICNPGPGGEGPFFGFRLSIVVLRCVACPPTSIYACVAFVRYPDDCFFATFQRPARDVATRLFVTLLLLVCVDEQGETAVESAGDPRFGARRRLYLTAIWSLDDTPRFRTTGVG